MPTSSLASHSLTTWSLWQNGCPFLHLYHVIHTSSINQWIIVTSGELKTCQQHIQFYAMPCWPTKNIFPVNLPPKKIVLQRQCTWHFSAARFPARFPPTPKTLVSFFSEPQRRAPSLDPRWWWSAPCCSLPADSPVSPRMCPTGELTTVEPEPSSFHQTSMTLGSSCSFSGVESGWQQGYRIHKSFILGVNHLHV